MEWEQFHLEYLGFHLEARQFHSEYELFPELLPENKGSELSEKIGSLLQK
jgi:hypothetical protein